MLDFIRIACAVPAVRVGDVKKNVEDICAYIEKADAQNADVLLFPELSMTGYTCGDLFYQDSLWNAVKAGLKEILACSKLHPGLNAVVGLPVRLNAKLLNCAAVIRDGGICGLVAKSYLSAEERRWFVSGYDLKETAAALDLFHDDHETFGYISLGRDQLFPVGDGAVLGIEICEDLHTPIPPSSELALNGANVILNLSASNETVGKRVFRQNLIKGQSASCKCIYAFASAGYTESTSDLVYSGHSLIAENGCILAENADRVDSDYMIIQDCDLGRVNADRCRSSVFQDAAFRYGSREYLIEPMRGKTALRSDGMLYPVRKLPFIPNDKQERHERCMEIFRLQVAGLARRLQVIGANAVIGISGGLDSTLALLVAVEAMRKLGRPVTDVHGITMPCFGTSDRTYNNSWELMRTLGVSAKEINIKEAVTLHFRDIGHDISVHNGTYENSQARERTQILMDYAGSVNAIVVGTGDLSELALGWCTYNGDHMSMYGVNADIPKTLIRWIIEAVSQSEDFAAARAVLQDVLDTPISPELLPPDAEGKISQQTEDLVGPYALHDFFLFYALRYGFAPAKIYHLACTAFAADFDAQTVKKWLITFYRRFFTQQFKRNCMPDGVKVGSVGLGPRGDWKMPSDASAKLWLTEAEQL